MDIYPSDIPKSAKSSREAIDSAFKQMCKGQPEAAISTLFSLTYEMKQSGADKTFLIHAHERLAEAYNESGQFGAAIQEYEFLVSLIESQSNGQCDDQMILSPFISHPKAKGVANILRPRRNFLGRPTSVPTYPAKLDVDGWCGYLALKRYALARAYMSDGQIDSAKACIEKALRGTMGREEKSGTIRTAQSLLEVQLARLFEDRGNLYTAEKLMERANERERRYLDENDPARTITLTNLARVRFRKGQSLESVERLVAGNEEALASLKSIRQALLLPASAISG